MLVEEAYERAIAVLKINSTKLGFRASKERYNDVWARDGCFTCIGGAASGVKEVVEASRLTLRALASLQTELGHIPNKINIDTGKVNYYSIDSNLWWIVAMWSYWKTTGDKQFVKDMLPSLRKAVIWLRYKILDQSMLIQSPPASDWMDSSVQRWGKVFYNNVLYYKALRCFEEITSEIGEAEETEHEFVKRSINLLFWPSEPVADEWLSGWSTEFYKEVIDPNRGHYLNFLSFESYDTRCDVLANSLAIIWGVADSEKTGKIVSHFEAKEIDKPYPVRVLDPPILQPDHSWNPKIDLYRPKHWQNLPYNYHNAGVWPWVGGVYVIAMSEAGRKGRAKEALERLAEANKVGIGEEWQFNEWLDGKSGKPMGATYQSWNAASYILAYKRIACGEEIPL